MVKMAAKWLIYFVCMILIIVSFLYLNSAVGHFWLSYGPPTVRPSDYYVHKAYMHLGIFVFLLFVGLVGILKTRRKYKRNSCGSVEEN